jgi:hypothetical protein
MMQALGLPTVQPPQAAPAAPTPAPAPNTQAQLDALLLQLGEAVDEGDIERTATLQQQIQALVQ